jgi:predicted DNA-binding transcriptional regulator YafY
MDPYALVHRWGWWYVIGFCHLREEIRTFRVDRITEILLSDSVFSIPTEFNLKVYLKSEQGAQPQIKAKLKVTAGSNQLVTSNPTFWESIEEQADGSLIVIFSSPTLEWAASTTLAYGPAVEALEPSELRLMVADWIESMSRNYMINKELI